jgi:flagellin-like protein
LKIWGILRDRKALSPLIATILVIGITVAVAGTLYGYTTGVFGAVGAKGQLSIETADLVRDTAGNAIFTATIKNVGTKPANAVYITLDGETEQTVNLPGGTLQPGQTVSVVYRSGAELTQTYTAGNTYTITLRATFTDGSTFSATTSVQCRYMG